MAKGREMVAVIGISGVLDKSMNEAIDEAKKRLGGIDPKAMKTAARIAGIGAAALKVGKEFAVLGDEYQSALNQLQASTGASAKEMKQLGDVVKGVYGNNFGESFEDVANGVAELKKQTGLMGPELQSVTEGAYTLQDVMGYDLTEAARAAKAMMLNFGSDGEEAMSMIAAGAQNGLDFSGELLDSISEYSVQFAKVGFSADDMFNIMQQGADSGAWNLDKVGDAIKEFSIRTIDGSNASREAFAAIGVDADEMMQVFARGGPEAKEAFSEVTKALLDMEDPVARDAAGVGLFGTMWEDLGVDAVKAMSEIQGSAYDTTGALEQMKDVKYDSMSEAMEAIRRQLEVGLLPAATWLANKIRDFVPVVSETISSVTPYFRQLADMLMPVLKVVGKIAAEGLKLLGDNMNALIPITGGVVTAFGVYKATLKAGEIATKMLAMQETLLAVKTKLVTAVTQVWTVVSKAAAVASRVLGAAFRFMMGPVGIVITIIGAVIAAGIALYKNWDVVKEKAIAFGNRVKGVFIKLKDGVVNAFSGMVKRIGKIFGMIAGVIKAPMNAVISVINGAIGKINGISIDVPDWVPKFGGETFGFDLPKIPLLAEGGFTDGVSIAGEAGTEAVISFDPAYRDQNLSYWAQAGRMLGADDYMIAGGTGGTSYNLGDVNYSPNVTIQGNASRTDILAALRESSEEFIDLLEEMLDRREVYSFEH